jgi:ribosome-associated translation inhibitor RaiA
MEPLTGPSPETEDSRRDGAGLPAAPVLAPAGAAPPLAAGSPAPAAHTLEASPTPTPEKVAPLPPSCRITFVGMDAVEAARLEVRAWLPRLGALTAPMTAGQVVIEAVEEHRKQRLYRVRMELTLPGGPVIVTHEHPNNAAHEDLYVAIRNAFRAARRQLENYFRTLPDAEATEAGHVGTIPVPATAVAPVDALPRL